MKKLAALAVCLLMVLSVFSACSQDPKAALESATKKTNELSSYESNVSMALKMEVSGVSVDVPMEINVKYAKKDDKVVMDTEANLKLMGMEVETDSYYADGYMYTEAMGQKMKTAVPVEEMMKKAPAASTLSGDAITELKTEKVDGGVKYIPTVDESKMNEFVESVLSQTQESMGSAANMGDLEGAEFSNLETYMIVNDEGYVTEQWVKMDVVVKVEVPDETGESTTETEIKMNIDMTNNFVNPGQEVTVTAPDDLDEYQEADAGL